ncbi:hypothetical protein [Amycolatopsis sp. FDAARGOS 1241]|uniref:DUF7677 family protein n=1 Tax=Amycolatopsis sp. FDAARGOS 1241 TaxID=2778070 RepID=UPI00194F4686|nr:hypothetical protein [Amycolatopsis sp. FDAARGOS 1241]QRP45283.1 hypothetical protein I6J71_40005 [Amycolatopsis sp. FDAARGOS 1241]
MTTVRLPTAASGTIRRIAAWVARGWVGHPLVDDIEYWQTLTDEPTAMEHLFAIFANVLQLGEDGEPLNEEYAERRAATSVFQYCTGPAS